MINYFQIMKKYNEGKKKQMLQISKVIEKEILSSKYGIIR